MKPVYVFGHRHPDNDSICSAVAYAYFKNVTDAENDYIPARLGPAPRETVWAFERWGATLPDEISHIHPRVGDVMSSDVIKIQNDRSMLEAGRIMRDNDLRALPVVDADEHVLGLLSERSLAMRYLEETQIAGFDEIPVTLEQLAQVVDGEILVGDSSRIVDGRVHIAAAEPETAVEVIEPGDVLILGNRKRTQPMALEAGASVLIITLGIKPDESVLELARQKDAAVILTNISSYVAARRSSLAQAVSNIMDTELTLTTPEMLLSDAQDALALSAQRELVVVDDDHTCMGVLTRTDVARGGRRRVVLVDHNEVSQSAEGIENASVVEIIDHHRVGDIQSAGPILFLNLPVGSTATIIATRFFDTGIEMPREIAGILLSALLTDTVLLKSPTTTPVDHEIAEKLCAFLDIDMMQYGMELFKSKSAGATFSAQAAVNADLKEYRVGDHVIAIGQYETVDLNEILDKKSEVIAEMNNALAEHGYDVVVLMGTDIIREGSEMFAVGDIKIAEKAFDASFESGSVWMDGVLSRKKQVAARFMDAS